ncbi:MAG: glycosyltransferase, partial [Phycisphaerales bacterium]|nr:glycosyltransferase [Phycisphaerales bacterium]
MEPRLAGITFLRNAVRLGYPFVESIRSILSIVDEFVVAVGESDDGTLEAVRAMDDQRIRVVPTVWNTSVPNGFVYAQQTMLALYQTRARWVLSMQGDEVVHEEDLPKIQASIDAAEQDDRVEALTFDYLHFYGRPDILGTGSRWYRREVRLLRNSKRFIVPSDAQCYTIIERNRRMRYPNTRASGARMFHYGWLRPTEAHLAKAIDVSPMWGGKVVPAKPYAQVDHKAL